MSMSDNQSHEPHYMLHILDCIFDIQYSLIFYHQKIQQLGIHIYPPNLSSFSSETSYYHKLDIKMNHMSYSHMSRVCICLPFSLGNVFLHTRKIVYLRQLLLTYWLSIYHNMCFIAFLSGYNLVDIQLRTTFIRKL